MRVIPGASDTTLRGTAGDAMRLLPRLPDASVSLFLTDPPYGIGYSSRTGETIKNDDAPFIWWMRESFRIAAPNAAMLCCCRWDVQEAFRLALGWAGWTVRSQIVWDRVHHGMGDTRRQFSPRHEVLWFATKGRWSFPARRPVSVVARANVHHTHRTHPCEKPVELAASLIAATTQLGDTVADPFCGSGWVGVACAQLGRSFWGCELDRDYARTASARIREAAR